MMKMLEFQQMRELFAYDIYFDRTVIRHDIRCGDKQWICQYIVKKYRKLLNPLTILRYRARSQRMLFEKMKSEGKSICDLMPLPTPEEYSIPDRINKVLCLIQP